MNYEKIFNEFDELMAMSEYVDFMSLSLLSSDMQYTNTNAVNTNTEKI
jgi:hypothetical protein